MKTMKLLTFAAGTISFGMMLSACGDTVTESMGVETVATVDDLQECSADLVGSMALVNKDGKMYYCDGSDWTEMKGDKGEAGAAGAAGDKGATGDKGGKGPTGEEGAKGASGKDGADGGDGKNNVKDLAYCGGESFVPGGEKKLQCLDNHIFATCILKDESEATYDIATHGCFDGEIKLQCSGEAYDDAKNACVEGKLWNFCGTFADDPNDEFKCEGTALVSKMVDARDNQEYKIVKIGDQVWMAENLNFDGTDAEGNSIEDAGGNLLYPELEKGTSIFCYGDDESNCAEYSLMYKYDAAVNACPEGWSLPSADDFMHLLTLAGGADQAAKKLKATDGWSESSGNGTDDFGFSLKAGGYRGESGNYVNVQNTGNIRILGNAGKYGFFGRNNETARLSNGVGFAISVRCIRD